MGAPQPPPPQAQGFLPEVDFVSDWQSFTSTLIGGIGDEHQQQQQQHQQQQQQQQQQMTNFAPQGFPMSWEDLGHFPGTPGT